MIVSVCLFWGFDCDLDRTQHFKGKRGNQGIILPEIIGYCGENDLYWEPLSSDIHHAYKCSGPY